MHSYNYTGRDQRLSHYGPTLIFGRGWSGSLQYRFVHFYHFYVVRFTLNFPPLNDDPSILFSFFLSSNPFLNTGSFVSLNISRYLFPSCRRHSQALSHHGLIDFSCFLAFCFVAQWDGQYFLDRTGKYVYLYSTACSFLRPSLLHLPIDIEQSLA